MKLNKIKFYFIIIIIYIKMVYKIAFGGKMGVGKDFAADYLIKNYSGNKLAFSKPLYDILHFAQEICGFENKKDRKFLQLVGTEWAKQKKSDVWINKLFSSVIPNENCFITDVRFSDEFYSLKKNGWKCIKILRLHQENREGTGSITHSSELMLDMIPDEDWDHIIENYGNEKEFQYKLNLFINSL